MVIVECPDYREVSHGAEEVTEDNVQYWSRHTKELRKSQVSKALKFVHFNCVRYVGDFDNSVFNTIKQKYEGGKHFFLCLPLNTSENHKGFGVTFRKMPYPVDYNSSEYIIFKNKDGNFECNCQGYQTKKRKGELVPGGANCSHVLALFYSFKIKRFRK